MAKGEIDGWRTDFARLIVEMAPRSSADDGGEGEARIAGYMKCLEVLDALSQSPKYPRHPDTAEFQRSAREALERLRAQNHRRAAYAAASASAVLRQFNEEEKS